MESEKGIEVDVVMAIKEYEGVCNRWEVPAHGHQYVVVEDAVGMNKKNAQMRVLIEKPKMKT